MSFGQLITQTQQAGALQQHTGAGNEGFSNVTLGGGPPRLAMTLQGQMYTQVGDQKTYINSMLGIPFLVNAAVQRVYYGPGEEMGQPPLCVSNDGRMPDPSSPALHDPSNPSGPDCDKCIWNQKGTGANGSRACAYKMRIGILPVDGTNQNKPLLWRVNAMSIFAAAMEEGWMTISQLTSQLRAHGNPDEGGFIYQFGSGQVATQDGAPMATILMSAHSAATPEWYQAVQEHRQLPEWRKYVLDPETAGGGSSQAVAAPAPAAAPTTAGAPQPTGMPAPPTDTQPAIAQGGLPPAEQPYPNGVTPGAHQPPQNPTELQPDQQPVQADPTPPAVSTAPVVPAPVAGAQAPAVAPAPAVAAPAPGVAPAVPTAPAPVPGAPAPAPVAAPSPAPAPAPAAASQPAPAPAPTAQPPAAPAPAPGVAAAPQATPSTVSETTAVDQANDLLNDLGID